MVLVPLLFNFLNFEFPNREQTRNHGISHCGIVPFGFIKYINTAHGASYKKESHGQVASAVEAPLTTGLLGWFLVRYVTYGVNVDAPDGSAGLGAVVKSSLRCSCKM